MTELLIDWGRALAESLANSAQAKAGELLSGRLTEVTSSCEQVTDRLLFAEKITENIKARDVDVAAFSKATVEGARKSKVQLRRIATSLGDSDLSDQQYLKILQSQPFNDALKFVEKLTKDRASAIGTGLNAFKAAKAPESIEQTVPDVPGEQGPVHLARQAQSRLRERVLISADDLDANGEQHILKNLKEILSDVKTWEEKFPRLLSLLEQQSPQFQKFLQAVAGPQGASLDLLTEDVLCRLRDFGTLDNYRVKSK